MDSIQLSQLWTVAAVLFGLQIAALAWRIRRETYMEATGETTWITLADLLVAASFLVSVVFVFVAPLSGFASTAFGTKMFGVALMMFAASPFVLAGHYNLYPFRNRSEDEPRPNVTGQEWATFSLSILLVTGGACWIFS